jgi:serine/threonine-protein kinase
VVAGRYRIATLLGDGGMGEVYRATDLRLGQPVALKFLPALLSSDARARDRFHNEVRVARQITHPNVCRVHDLGEVDGHAFLSMEYIDGEDLASLLRRIGRLPADKAVQMARQLCAGLAAAHEQGVLHRDLKPGNVMLDGRGQLRIMDFGLAAVAGEIQRGDIRSGTLSYMAPEQMEGREVTARSDIYALGLVLYEMFTGKRPFAAQTLAELREKQDSTQPESMMSQVADLDPAVERVILRCLAPDPADRPQSPLSIAAALPGGDPLAAAVAAGETPSPELVAAAGSQGALAPVWVAACLAVIVPGLATMAFLGGKVSLLAASAPRKSPEVLAAGTEQLLRQLEFDDPADRYYSLQIDGDFYRWVKNNTAAKERFPRYLERPGAMRFFYRESPEPMINRAFSDAGAIGAYDPPLIRSGMVTVLTDLEGRLIWLDAVPPEKDSSPPRERPIDWQPLFDAAGLDPSRFHNVDPEWQPRASWDTRMAWEGSFEERPDTPIRVEMGAWRGKPTHFYVIGPWTTPARMSPGQRTGIERFLQAVNLVLLAGIGVGMVVFARYNLKRGRGDRRGALVLGLFVFVCVLAEQALSGHHVAGVEEVSLVTISLGMASLLGLTVVAGYLALEPPVRRKWPATLISWSRLLAGRFYDPLVGTHILIGLAAGVAIICINEGLALIPGLRDPGGSGFSAFVGLRHTLSYVIATLSLGGALNALLNFFLLFLFRLVFRRDWLSLAVFVLTFSVLNSLNSPNPWIYAPVLLTGNVIWSVTILRFGLLAIAATHFVLSVANHFHLTWALGSWYGSPAIVANIVMLAMAVWAARVALGGRRLISADLLDR